jgi:hypothetical protein
MTVYYKLNTDSDSLAYSYNFDELLRFNNYQHNYTGTEVGNALTFPPWGKTTCMYELWPLPKHSFSSQL